MTFSRFGRPAAAALGVASVLGLASAAPAPAWAAGHEPTAATGDYVPFASLSATVLHANGSRGVMSVQGGLKIPDAAVRTLAQKSMPRLRDAWVRVLATYALALPPGAPPDADRIAASLDAATQQVLKRPGARVLLGTILVN